MIPHEPSETPGSQTDRPSAQMERFILVVIDDSPEMKVAMRYACLKAAKTGGRVALLYVLEPTDFQQWKAVGELMLEESRQEAEKLMQKVAAEVIELSGKMPVLFLREGVRSEELLKLLAEQPNIALLVLGAAIGSKGPGPLITALVSKLVARLSVPLTIVPGNLTSEDCERVT